MPHSEGISSAGNPANNTAKNMAKNTAPVLSHASAPLTHQIHVMDASGRPSLLTIPAERALTLYLDKHELLTLMTLGSEPEALILGYLRNQRLIRQLADIASVQVDWDVQAAAITTHHGVTNLKQKTAKKTVTTGCGQGSVFGDLMDEVDQLKLTEQARLHQSVIFKIVEMIRGLPSIYKQAGSVHGCALFSNTGSLIYFVEDVGRHNAVDAIAGKMWLDQIDGSDKIFYTTGRLTSEMVIKGAQMGIPFLLSRSGSTQMGHSVAQQVGMTLLTRCSGKHFLLLSHHQRLIYDCANDDHSVSTPDSNPTSNHPSVLATNALKDQ